MSKRIFKTIGANVTRYLDGGCDLVGIHVGITANGVKHVKCYSFEII